MLLNKVAAQGLLFDGADVANAYLYGDLNTPVVMGRPNDWNGIPGKLNHIALVLKSIYGYNAVGSIWGSFIHQSVFKWGFKQSRVDAWMYLLHTVTGYPLLPIFVDVMLLASNSHKLI